VFRGQKFFWQNCFGDIVMQKETSDKKTSLDINDIGSNHKSLSSKFKV